MAIQITPYIWSISSLNPGLMTLKGTNTFLIGKKFQKILIDAGNGNPLYSHNLHHILQKTESQISKILITHYHEDHTHGLKFISNRKNLQIRKGLCGLKQDEILQKKWNFEYKDLNEGEIIGVEDDTELKIKPIKCPGHTDDHFGFLFFPEKIFFCGDCILGNGSTVINNLTNFMASLEKIKNLNDFEHLFPAHGDLILSKEKSMKKINEYIEHRMTREEQIVARLKASKCSIENLVQSIYPNILDSYLIQMAKENVICHLDKLIQERKVKKTEKEIYHLL